jgi:hypothetical protein
MSIRNRCYLRNEEVKGEVRNRQKAKAQPSGRALHPERAEARSAQTGSDDDLHPFTSSSLSPVTCSLSPLHLFRIAPVDLPPGA